jgi:signal peptidase I
MMGWAAASAVCGAVLLATWARARLVLVTVYGSSMSPTFRDGDRVLVRRRTVRRLRRGDAVILRPPPPVGPGGRRLRAVNRWNVKRVAALPGDQVPAEVLEAAGHHPSVPADAIVVLGDNPKSADSRSLGFYPAAGVLGVVVLRLSNRS